MGWFVGFYLCSSSAIAQQHPNFDYAPRTYSCWFTDKAPAIDGKLDEDIWAQTPSTESFVDIEGDIRPAPSLRTTVKMRWDNNYLYIAATLQEPHIWATYNQRDMVLFQENNFEVFIDPDGDAYHYYELEINALNTIWDLMLTQPYRNGGRPLDAWQINGLLHAVNLEGTLNNPTDKDNQWTVELALPWSVLEEAAKHKGAPRFTEIWWLNFSRVQWQTIPDGMGYTKKVNPTTGKPYPEYNWVWSPQGAIAMHQPETWGLIAFMPEGQEMPQEQFFARVEAPQRWTLWQHYYLQKQMFHQYGKYGKQNDFPDSSLHILADDHIFYTSVKTKSGWLSINHNGQITKHRHPKK